MGPPLPLPHTPIIQTLLFHTNFLHWGVLGFKIKIEFCGKFTFLAESTETLNIECINIARVEMDRERVRDREIELDHYIIEYKLENVGTRQVRIMFFFAHFFLFFKEDFIFISITRTRTRDMPETVAVCLPTTPSSTPQITLL